VRSIRDIVGNTFVIQSPKKPAQYLLNAVNNFMVTERENVKNMTVEQFETQKKSVWTQLSVKAVNQRQDFDKAWAQIANHKYQFTIQADSLRLLEEITLDDFKQHFEKTFFSASTARLDFALITEKHFADNEKIDHEIFK
jgi:secreted Zn-dependent insulinase-like peptidase